MQELSRSGSSRAVVLVKALPQISEQYGETVCVAAIDEYGQWKRLYPVTFSTLDKAQQFGRWDLITFNWRLPDDLKDRRQESLRVDQRSIVVERKLPNGRREAFLNRSIVTSNKRQLNEGRSLSLLRPAEPKFHWKRRSTEDLDRIRGEYARLQATPTDLFGESKAVEREPAPFDFFYRYRDDDGQHDAQCHDWEVEATFLRRRREMGETAALDWMGKTFGDDYPAKACCSPWAPTRGETGNG